MPPQLDSTIGSVTKREFLFLNASLMHLHELNKTELNADKLNFDA